MIGFIVGIVIGLVYGFFLGYGRKKLINQTPEVDKPVRHLEEKRPRLRIVKGVKRG